MTVHKPKVIYSFTGDHRFLSNFHPCLIEYDEVHYPSVEHAYQAAKTEDPKERDSILLALTPGQAKSLGRMVKLRADWSEIKLSVMEFLIQQKFQEPTLRAKLMKTEDAELVEGNTWNDFYWGKCRGQGANHLGRILMKVREEIRESM